MWVVQMQDPANKVHLSFVSEAHFYFPQKSIWTFVEEACVIYNLNLMWPMDVANL